MNHIDQSVSAQPAGAEEAPAQATAASALTRRTFLGSAAVALGVLTNVPSLHGANGRAAASAKAASGAGHSQFPEDFAWGAATAAYQVEGAANEDGRKPSVWDTFSHTPGRTQNGDTGDVACGHYHRFEDDVKLMADLGIGHYRFSIAWPRIVPDGRGAVNQKGLDFYSRLVDSLLKYGITPHATLFHWDSPQALEDRYGSWRSREMARDFADYCSVTVRHLGDRIAHWITMNEISCFTYAGYGVGSLPSKAPGTLVESAKQVQQTVHHALLAHGMACQAIRAASRVKPQVSVACNNDYYVPVIETPENIAAAYKACFAGQHNSTILTPILTGQYRPETLAALGANAPDIANGDLTIIGQPLDSIGLNIYTGSYVRAAANPVGYEVLPIPRNYPNMSLSWLNILPESIYWAIRSIGEGMGRKDLPIVITENGCASDDEVTNEGEIIDSSRIMYLRSHLRNVQRAIAEGYPVKGYFQWSLLDNFEWSEGYSKRFGITHVDYETQKRTPKMSYHWYRQVIRENRIL